MLCVVHLYCAVEILRASILFLRTRRFNLRRAVEVWTNYVYISLVGYIYIVSYKILAISPCHKEFEKRVACVTLDDKQSSGILSNLARVKKRIGHGRPRPDEVTVAPKVY